MATFNFSIFLVLCCCWSLRLPYVVWIIFRQTKSTGSHHHHHHHRPTPPHHHHQLASVQVSIRRSTCSLLISFSLQRTVAPLITRPPPPLPLLSPSNFQIWFSSLYNTLHFHFFFFLQFLSQGNCVSLMMSNTQTIHFSTITRWRGWTQPGASTRRTIKSRWACQRVVYLFFSFNSLTKRV